ncbi:MAG: ATP-binding protein [Pseudomonadota bacterium]
MKPFDHHPDNLYLSLAQTGRWQLDLDTDTVELDALSQALLNTQFDYLSSGELYAGLGAAAHRFTAVLSELDASVVEDPARIASVTLDLHWPDTPVQYRKFVMQRDRLNPRKIVGVVSRGEASEVHDLQRKVIDAIPYPVGYFTRDGRISYANRTFYAATGIQAAQTSSASAQDLLGADEIHNGMQAFVECMSGKRVVREAETALPNGPSYYCRYVYEPVYDTGNDVVQGVCVTVFDLTEIKQAESSLQNTAADLSRSNHDLEQFAYVASHDLKAPLRAIDVVVGWLREDLADDPREDVHENLEMLGQRTARLNKLLDDLLAYSRAGRKVGEQSVVDCGHLVEDIWSYLAPAETFKLQVVGELPSLFTHGAPLELVFRNLIANAIKHHPGPRGLIEVSAEEFDDKFVFAVADDGCGISPEYADRVFQMFQTLKPRDECEGSGMGLAIVSRIVEWQNGRVWFEPAANGSGTVFKFEWCYTTADDGAPDQDASFSSSPATMRESVA